MISINLLLCVCYHIILNNRTSEYIIITSIKGNDNSIRMTGYWYRMVHSTTHTVDLFYFSDFYPQIPLIALHSP